MKTLNILEITQQDNVGLAYKILYNEEYSIESILLVVAELNRRKYILPERHSKILADFLVKNNINDLEGKILELVKKEGFNSYSDYYKSGEKLKKSGVTNEDERYPALNVISLVFKIFAWIGIVATVIIVIALFIKSTFLFGVVSLISGSVLCLFLFAISELIKLFIDIENNTRQVLKK